MITVVHETRVGGVIKAQGTPSQIDRLYPALPAGLARRVEPTGELNSALRWDGSTFRRFRVAQDYYPIIWNAYMTGVNKVHMQWGEDQVGLDSIQATFIWHHHACQGAVNVVNDRLSVTLDESETQVAIFNGYLPIIPLTKTWYGVMRDDADKRNGWLGNSTAQGQTAYPDWLDGNTGLPRTVDGTHNLPGLGTFRTNFDPEDPSTYSN